jgi:uncharacterized protein (DUF1330 family)
MKTTFLSILFAILFCQVFSQTPNFDGRWFSTQTENQGQAFATRDFTLSGTSWKLTYTMYADSCKLFPLFAFDAEGTFKVGKKSKIVTNANEADFTFVKKYLTILTADPSVVQMFGFISCNLKQGEKTDISENGCSFFPSVKNYGLEYDLLSLSNGILQLGYRPADNNMGKPEFRPKALGYPLETYNKAKHMKIVENPIKPILSEGQCLAVINVKIKDQQKFMQYVAGHLGSISLYGGKIIFEGFDKTTYEGTPADYQFLVIQQWESKEAFDKWWNSPEYAKWKQFRSQGADVTVQLVKQKGELH